MNHFRLKIGLLIAIQWMGFQFCQGQKPTTNNLTHESPQVRIGTDIDDKFDLQRRSLEVRFQELLIEIQKERSNQATTIWGILIGGLIVLGFGYKDILRRARAEVDKKVDKVIDEKTEKVIVEKVIPATQQSVRLEVRQRINDISRAASYFAFEEKVRREQEIMILCHQEEEKGKMIRLLAKLEFVNIRAFVIGEERNFNPNEVIIFADPKGEMNDSKILKYLGKLRKDNRYIYYGPNNNNALRPFLNKFSASNNCHTLLPRIMEAVRFRDQFDISPEDDIMAEN